MSLNDAEQCEFEIRELKAEIEQLKKAKSAEVSLVELFNEEFFGALPNYLVNLTGEGAASMILRESLRDATISLLKNQSNLKKRVDTAETFEDKFNQCYSIYQDLGFPFEYEVIEESDEVLVIKITTCPHIDYTKKNPAACNTCEGIKLGVIETLFGVKVPAIKKTSCLARGDDFCMIEIPKKAPTEIMID